MIGWADEKIRESVSQIGHRADKKTRDSMSKIGRQVDDKTENDHESNSPYQDDSKTEKSVSYRGSIQI